LNLSQFSACAKFRIRAAPRLAQVCLRRPSIVPKCFETGAQVLSDSCGGLLSVIPFAHSDLEGIMAHRRIGQEALRLDARAGRQTSLDELHALLDWAPADRALASVYGAAKGEKAWPPLAMFTAL